MRPDSEPVRTIRAPGGTRRTARILVGVVGVVALTAGVWWGGAARSSAGTGQVLGELWGAWARPARRMPVAPVAGLDLREGDPVFVAAADGSLELAGRLLASAEGVSLRLRPGAPELGSGARLAAYRADDSMAWVVGTILPAHKREELGRLIRAAYAEHGAEVTAALQPLVRESVKDALVAIQRELPEVLRAHRAELQELGSDYQDALVRDELLPMAQAQLLPLVEAEARPLLTRVGREIWERVSLWRVGSRYVWDRLPGTSGTSLEKEWERVLKDEALPVVREHADEFVALLRDVVRKASRNPMVRASLRRVYGQVVDDPRVHRLVESMFRQAVIDNQGLRDALSERWKGERAKAAMQLAERRFQPTAQKVGEILFGVRGEGIAPEFAVVLRNRLLLKDRRWLVLRTGDPRVGEPVAPLPVVRGVGGADPFQPGTEPGASKGGDDERR